MDDLKAAARKAAVARRKAAFDASSSPQAGALSGFLAGHRGVPVSGFMPIHSEIDPLPAMAEAAAYGSVGVPVIRSKAQPLVFSVWEPEAEMVEGAFRAMVPAVQRLMVPEIVIVPLLAFDRDGGRLGYGGGYYDRTLEGLRARGPVLAIGFAFGAQEAQSLPLEATDQPLDLVITEAEVIEVAPR